MVLHTTFNRVYYAVTTFMTALGFGALVISLLMFHKEFTPQLSDDVNFSAKLLEFREWKGRDVAIISCHLEADISSSWCWSTKQLYVSVILEYGQANETRRLVVWDEIIAKKEDTHLSISKSKPISAQITDSLGKLNDVRAKATFFVDVMPWVGFFWRTQSHTIGTLKFKK